MISNDCRSEAFVKGRKDTLRVETLTNKVFARKLTHNLRHVRNVRNFAKKKIFHVYCLKKLTKDKKMERNG